MKVALVYDRVNKWGGAERVLLTLHKLFPNAPLYTSVYNNRTAGWADEFLVNSSFLQNFPSAKTAHELYPLVMPIAFESFTFDDYDLVISVTSEAAKGIITKPSTKHICYCLTPTRYLWSGYEVYFSSILRRIAAYPFVSYLRWWDKAASLRPDHYISISQEVKKRIKKYYNRDSSIVYPPVSLGLTKIPQTKISIKQRDYYLLVARLVPYKKVSLAVKACTELNRPLVVVGIGAELMKLKKISGPSIIFVGSVSDEELAEYYRHSRALLFPGEEDFGITMVESQAFGKPVIAYGAGGALEIVKRDITGVFFSPQTVNGLVKAILRFEKLSFSASVCTKQAALFSEIVFEKELMKHIEGYFANS